MEFATRYQKWMSANYLKMMTFGPLPLRIVAGAAFILHGLVKFQDMPGTLGFFATLGLPQELVALVAILEVAGGIAILTGVLTRITSALFIAEMAGTTLAVKLPRGFIGGYEIDLLLLAMTASLLLTGPGKPSLEWLLRRELVPRGKWIMNGIRALEAASSVQNASAGGSGKVKKYTSDGKPYQS
ncbi:DoxX family protein [Nitrososphaera sp.]|uniref:DoxX family protein n=1 Tax=Nitrososphaera sp. TaxID=1971748 RepID=UPI00307D6D6C